MSQDVQVRKTPQGYLIKVVTDSLRFVVTTPSGTSEVLEGGITPVPTPRVIFYGKEFDLSHFSLGDLNFVNTKDKKMVIPYMHGGSRDMKVIGIPVESLADVHPVILYHFKDSAEMSAQSTIAALAKHLVVDESAKNEMIGFKIRYPKMNVYIQKKK